MQEEANAENSEQIIADAEKLLQSEEKVEAKPQEGTPAVEITPEVPPEKEEEVPSQSDKSKHGRQIKYLQKQNEELTKMLSDIKSNLDVIRERSVPKSEDDSLPEIPTPEDIAKFVSRKAAQEVETILAKEKREQIESTQKYQKDYIRLLQETVDMDEDPELYKMLTDEKDLTYNKMHKGNAQEDFLINFRNATNAVLKKTRAPRPNVQGKAPTNVNVPSSTKPSKTFNRDVMSPLEQQAAKMFSDEELAELLK